MSQVRGQYKIIYDILKFTVCVWFNVKTVLTEFQFRMNFF